MNLFKLHDKPTTLHDHDRAHDMIPELSDELFSSDNPISDEQLHAITNDAKLALKYTIRIINRGVPTKQKQKRWPPGEKAIASNPYTAWIYANDIIKGKWPKGEKAIASSLYSAISYATEVIHGKWPPGEQILSTDPFYTEEYNDMLKSNGYSKKDMIQSKMNKSHTRIAHK